MADENDIRAQRAKFLEQRQSKIDAANEEQNGGADGSERGTVTSQFANPPSVRATDGKPPGTKQENPLELAEKLGADAEETYGGIDDSVEGDQPDDSWKVPEIKAYLDSKGIEYDAQAKKADLLELV